MAAITANAIAPVTVETDMTHRWPSRALEQLRQTIPFRRLARVSDMATGILPSWGVGEPIQLPALSVWNETAPSVKLEETICDSIFRTSASRKGGLELPLCNVTGRPFHTYILRDTATLEGMMNRLLRAYPQNDQAEYRSDQCSEFERNRLTQSMGQTDNTTMGMTI
jgi:hypothetical protein